MQSQHRSRSHSKHNASNMWKQNVGKRMGGSCSSLRTQLIDRVAAIAQHYRIPAACPIPWCLHYA
jgi:hypothetical protein